MINEEGINEKTIINKNVINEIKINKRKNKDNIINENKIIEDEDKEEEKKKSIKKQEYKLTTNKINYHLTITIDDNYINFTLTPVNEIAYIYYKNKFSFKNIINILDLNIKAYNNLDKILELINDSFSKNKVLIKFDKNNNANILVKYPLGIKDYECLIPLKTADIDINKKFEIIFNEISLLKINRDSSIDDKIRNIETLLLNVKNYVNQKLQENQIIIDALEAKIQNNITNLEKNRKIINLLKLEIFKVNYSEMKNKIYDVFVGNDAKGKGFLTKIIDENDTFLFPVLITNSSTLTEPFLENKILLKNSDNEKIELDLNNRMKYSNKDYGITIIELNEKDTININQNNYLELDKKQINLNLNININSYIGESIYLLDNIDNILSYGTIKDIEQDKKYIFKFETLNSMGNNTFGLPIINIINNRIIGIYTQNNEDYFGVFLKYPLNSFIDSYYKSKISDFNKRYS